MQKQIYNFFLDLIFPKACRVCGAFDTWLCDNCLSKITLQQKQLCAVCVKPSNNGLTHPDCRSRNTLDGLLVASNFRQLQGLIHSYKYGLIKDLGLTLAEILVNFIENQNFQEFINDFVIVPVPLHKKRRRFRGFNQSEILAKILAQAFELQQKDLLLLRKKNTIAQTSLNRKQRISNIENAFETKRPSAMNYEKVLLVDDIATTGATLNECAKVLKKSGAKSVWALVLAHG